jgi:hypothetical protein
MFQNMTLTPLGVTLIIVGKLVTRKGSCLHGFWASLHLRLLSVHALPPILNPAKRTPIAFPRTTLLGHEKNRTHSAGWPAYTTLATSSVTPNFLFTNGSAARQSPHQDRLPVRDAYTTRNAGFEEEAAFAFIDAANAAGESLVNCRGMFFFLCGKGGVGMTS